MSIADLRVRLGDVPGIQNLTMALEAGRIMLRWGDGFAASASAAASDAEIEAVVRAAAKLPPVTLIPDKPAPAAPAAAPIAQEGRTVSANPADAMAALDASMADHVRRMQDLIDGQVRMIEAKQDRQRQTVEKHLTAFGDRLDEQTDAFEAIMSRYTNS